MKSKNKGLKEVLRNFIGEPLLFLISLKGAYEKSLGDRNIE